MLIETHRPEYQRGLGLTIIINKLATIDRLAHVWYLGTSIDGNQEGHDQR